LTGLNVKEKADQGAFILWALEAFIGMLEGGNFGKLILQLTASVIV